MSQGKYPSLRNLLRICADRSRPVAGAWSGVRCSQSGVRCYQSVRGPVLSCRFGAIRPVRCYQSGPVLSVRGSVLSGRFGVINQVQCYQTSSVLPVRGSVPSGGAACPRPFPAGIPGSRRIQGCSKAKASALRGSPREALTHPPYQRRLILSHRQLRARAARPAPSPPNPKACGSERFPVISPGFGALFLLGSSGNSEPEAPEGWG